jgi:hypothetical protein
VSVRSIYEVSLIGLGEVDAMRCDATQARQAIVRFLTPFPSR